MRRHLYSSAYSFFSLFAHLVLPTPPQLLLSLSPSAEDRGAADEVLVDEDDDDVEERREDVEGSRGDVARGASGAGCVWRQEYVITLQRWADIVYVGDIVR